MDKHLPTISSSETNIVTSPLATTFYSATVRKRGLFIALVDNFLMNCGFFMVIRLLSLHYVEQLQWSAASIGLVLAVRQFLQQGFNPISGLIADSLGPKRLICVGLGLRILSFTCMAWASTFPLLLFSAITMGLAGSLFDAPLAATIAALTTPDERNRFYSLYGITSELGTVIGVQIGVLLIALSFQAVALGAALCFLSAALASLIFLPPIRTPGEHTQPFAGIRLALHDIRFLLFSALLMGFWFMWVQLTISLPLAVKLIGGTNATLSLVYGLNSGVSILLSYPLLRLTARHFREFQILIGGMALMAVGFAAIAFAHTVLLLLLCVLAVSLGTLFAMPSQKTVAAQLAHPSWLGTYLGINSLALACGGALGNYSGGLLYDLGRTLHMPALPWLTIGTLGLLATLGLFLLSHHTGNARRAHDQEQSFLREKRHKNSG